MRINKISILLTFFDATSMRTLVDIEYTDVHLVISLWPSTMNYFIRLMLSVNEPPEFGIGFTIVCKDWLLV